MSKKERFYIEGDKLFDNIYLLGLVRDFRDLDFVDMLNSLAEQLAEKDKEIEKLEREKELDNSFWKQECDSLQKTLAEKDKEIEELKLEAMRWEEHFNNARMDYQCLEEDKNKEIAELKKDLKSQKGLTDLYSTIAGTNATKMSIEKATRHQICEKIREKCQVYATGPTGKIGYIVRDTELDLLEKGE